MSLLTLVVQLLGIPRGNRRGAKKLPFVWAVLLLLACCRAPQAAEPAEGTPAKRCFKCHGEDGADISDGTPYIAGHSLEYLQASIARFKSKKRPGSQMIRIVRTMTAADMSAVARYFASLPRPVRAAPHDAKLAEKGREVHARLCDKCHSDGGRSFNSGSTPGPILAGQSEEYLRSEMEFFYQFDRDMPRDMGAAVLALRPGELDALVHFYAAQGGVR